MNCYELTKKMWEIDEEIQGLNDKLKVADFQDKEWISKRIDQKLSEFMDLKHRMERVNINSL